MLKKTCFNLEKENTEAIAYTPGSGYKCSIHFERRAKFCLKCVVQNLYFHPRKGVWVKIGC